MMNLFQSRVTGLLFIFILGAAITSFLIYSTPLRYTDKIEPKIHDIESKEFYEAYKINPDGYIFIDVRSEDSYKKTHALNSLSVPLHTLYDDRHILPKEGKEIVLICSGGRASGVAYSYLEHFGFKNISRIEGGIETWIENGLPTEVSP